MNRMSGLLASVAENLAPHSDDDPAGVNSTSAGRELLLHQVQQARGTRYGGFSATENPPCSSQVEG
jgi:hypothetical protein